MIIRNQKATYTIRRCTIPSGPQSYGAGGRGEVWANVPRWPTLRPWSCTYQYLPAPDQRPSARTYLLWFYLTYTWSLQPDPINLHQNRPQTHSPV